VTRGSYERSEFETVRFRLPQAAPYSKENPFLGFSIKIAAAWSNLLGAGCMAIEKAFESDLERSE